ncbi:unnamed protein product [Laminaria digitata]
MDCDNDGRLAKLYTSSRLVDECDGPIDADVFNNFTETLDENYTIAPYSGDHVVCDSRINAPTGERSLEERCTCGFDYKAHVFTPCWWAALSRPLDGICFAQTTVVNTRDGAVTGVWNPFNLDSCWPRHPAGTVALTITALVVALSTQLLAAFVGFKNWNETENRSYACCIRIQGPGGDCSVVGSVFT